MFKEAILEESMLEEIGRIVAIDNDALWVETIQKSTCGSCAARQGCGQSLLSSVGVKPAYLRVLLGGRAAESYQLNQEITLGIPNDIVVKGSFIVYLLPLVFMLVFSGIAHTYFLEESLSIVWGLMGFVIGALLVRWHARYYRNDSRHQPIIMNEQQPVTVCFNQKNVVEEK